MVILDSLKNNKLTSLPDSIGNLPYLGGLYLANNKLTLLPSSFGKLTNLTSLSLDNNPIEKLPKSLLKFLPRDSKGPYIELKNFKIYDTLL